MANGHYTDAIENPGQSGLPRRFLFLFRALLTSQSVRGAPEAGFRPLLIYCFLSTGTDNPPGFEYIASITATDWPGLLKDLELTDTDENHSQH